MAGADTPQWAVMPGEQQYASVLRSSMAIIGVAGSEEFSVGCIQGRVLSVIYGAAQGETGVSPARFKSQSMSGETAEGQPQGGQRTVEHCAAA